MQRGRVFLGVVLFMLVSHLPVAAGTIEDIRSSGVLTCGVALNNPGFSVRDNNYKWSGFNVDLCRAIAAAVVGKADKVNFVAIAENERVVALQSGEIDVLVYASPWNYQDDAANGLMFVQPSFVETAADHTLRIYGPMVRQRDDQWFQLVRWVLITLQQAEELGVTADNIDSLTNSTDPRVKDFLAGDQPNETTSLNVSSAWRSAVIKGVGNYGEIFVRNFPGTDRKLNQSWRSGGIFITPP